MTDEEIQNLDCSDGAKILLTQMRENPQDFLTYSGRFRTIMNALVSSSKGSLDMPSTRDAAALQLGIEMLREHRLMEEVMNVISGAAEREQETATYKLRNYGKSVSTSIPPGAFVTTSSIPPGTLIGTAQGIASATPNLELRQAMEAMDRLQLTKLEALNELNRAGLLKGTL